MRIAAIVVVSLTTVVGCGGGSADAPEAPASIRLGSEAFADGGAIPKRFTCDGEDAAPPLAWSGLPEGTKSLALLVEDPDAPGGLFTHWVVFGIDPGRSGLPEGVKRDDEGFPQGRNDFGNVGYGGPCPPRGTHRYVFRLYALSRPLELSAQSPPNRAKLLKAMEGAVLARGVLTSTYQR